MTGFIAVVKLNYYPITMKKLLTNFCAYEKSFCLMMQRYNENL